METLGLTPSRKADSIWRNLLWPTIRTEVDVDQVGRQGFWLCVILAAFTLVFALIGGLYISGIGEAAFYLLGGMGVRQRSRIAAVVLFSTYLLSAIAVFKLTGRGPGFVGVIFLALLFANVRGTLLSAKWRPDATEPPPIRLTTTLGDRIADQLPIHVWPIGQWFFLALAFLEIGLLLMLLFWPEALFFRIV
jgi:hypothetical protein